MFGLIVFVHELGHFLMAKRSGVKVEEFAFGFPPRLIAKKIGETTYAINAIPLGGYVRMLGENDDNNDARSFSQANKWQRALIIVAGVTANLLLAWILLTIILVLPARYKGSDAVLVAGVLPNSAAKGAGLNAGDMILKINDVAITSPDQLRSATHQFADQSVTIELRRGGQIQNKSAKLVGGDAPLGVSVSSFSLADEENPPLLKAPVVALKSIGRVTVAQLQFIGSLVLIPFQGASVDAEQVSGPVGIYGILAQFTALGWVYVLFGAAQLSLAVALFNILPIPALDGGRLLFIVMESVFRRKVLSNNIENIVHTVGFVLLIGLFIFVTYNDIVKLIR